jgi:hypothetical protein
LKSDWRSKNSTRQLHRTPHYRIVRDGLTLLAMDLTGKKALAFKLAYMMPFNAWRPFAAGCRHSAHGIQRMALAFNLVAKAITSKTTANLSPPTNLDCPPAPCTVDCDRPDAGLPAVACQPATAAECRMVCF